MKHPLKYPVTAACAGLLALVCAAPVVAVEPTAFEQHTGGFVLELDVPTARTRGRCVEVGIYNFGAVPDGRLWVVARSVDESQPTLKSRYYPIGRVEIPASRLGKARVCLSQIPELAAADSAQLPTLDVAVYSVTARDLAEGGWSGPDGGGMRRSLWLPLRGELWRTRDGASSTARARR